VLFTITILYFSHYTLRKPPHVTSQIHG
jgi:hypothetical protein